MCLIWLLVLVIWMCAGGDIPVMAWLILIPFFMQDVFDYPQARKNLGI